MVRRLPVLNSPDPNGPPRPRWHWVLIGAGFFLTIWLPLAILVFWLEAALNVGQRSNLHLAAAILASYLFAGSCAGLLMTRFGPQILARHAYAAGALAGTLSVALAALSAVSLTPIVLGLAWLILSACGALGARLGCLFAQRLGKAK